MGYPARPEIITNGDRARIEMGRAAVCPLCRRCVSIRTPKGYPATLRVFYPHGPIQEPCRTSERAAPGWTGKATA
jgi:hypothetical protein